MPSKTILLPAIVRVENILSNRTYRVQYVIAKQLLTRKHLKSRKLQNCLCWRGQRKVWRYYWKLTAKKKIFLWILMKIVCPQPKKMLKLLKEMAMT